MYQNTVLGIQIWQVKCGRITILYLYIFRDLTMASIEVRRNTYYVQFRNSPIIFGFSCHHTPDMGYGYGQRAVVAVGQWPRRTGTLFIKRATTNERGSVLGSVRGHERV